MFDQAKETLSSLSWEYAIPVIVIGLIFALKKSKKGGGSSKPKKSGFKFGWIDEGGRGMTPDPNGIQDQLAVIAWALAEGHEIVYMGAAQQRVGSGRTNIKEMQDLNALAGINVPVYQGDLLHRKIVEHAHKGVVNIGCGAPCTDISRALKLDPSIAGKLRVGLMGSWNVTQDRNAWNHVWNSVKAKFGIDPNGSGNEVYTLIKASPGDAWYKKQLGQSKAGKYLLSHGNLAHAGAMNHQTSSVRIADVMTAIGLKHGKKKAMDPNYVYKTLAKGYGMLP